MNLSATGSSLLLVFSAAGSLNLIKNDQFVVKELIFTNSRPQNETTFFLIRRIEGIVTRYNSVVSTDEYARIFLLPDLYEELSVGKSRFVFFVFLLGGDFRMFAFSTFLLK